MKRDEHQQNVGRTVRNRSRRDHEGDYPLDRFRQAAGGRKTWRARRRMCACWRAKGSSPRTMRADPERPRPDRKGNRRRHFVFKRELEDIHLNIEARLAEIDGPRGGPAAHRPFAQRPGGDGFPAVGAGGLRARRPGLARVAAGAARAGGKACRHHHARLHPYAAGPARDLRPSSAGLCRDVRPRPRPFRRREEADE